MPDSRTNSNSVLRSIRHLKSVMNLKHILGQWFTKQLNDGRVIGKRLFLSCANDGIARPVAHLLAIFNVAWSLADRVAVWDLPAPVLQSARSTISCQGKRPDQDQTLELIRPALRLRCTRSDVLAQACSARFASWTRPGLSSRLMVLRCLHGNRAISLTVCLAFKWMRNWYFFRMWRLKKSYKIFFVIWLEKIPLHL